MGIKESLHCFFEFKETVNKLRKVETNSIRQMLDISQNEFVKGINSFKTMTSQLDNSKLLFINSNIINECLYKAGTIIDDLVEAGIKIEDVANIIENESHKYLILNNIKLPFDDIYILLERPFEDSTLGHNINVCGLLVSNSGYIYTINKGDDYITSHNVILSQNIITCNVDCYNDGDNVMLNLQLLQLNIFSYYLLEHISKHQVDKKIINQASTKIRKLRKTIKKLPKDYYTIGLSSAITLHQEYRSESEAKHSYQYDVRGCWVTRMVRGNLPINKWLQDGNPNRTIYTNMNQLPPEMLIFFNTKGITIEEGEWISVLKTWRKDHIRGPEDKPYIPAIRTL